MAKTRVSSSFVRSICFTLCIALSLSGLSLPARTQSQQAPQPGVRTQGAPSPNLPNIDAKRNSIEPLPTVPAIKSANRCRWADTKCKQEKGKSSINLNPFEDIGLDANGERLFANVGNFDLRNWRNDTPAERWLNFPLSEFSPNSIKPIHDLPTGKEPVAASAAAQSITYNDIMTARVDAKYRTGSGGEDLFSGNYNWSLPIMGFSGRSGHDLGLTLSYNSTMWVRVGNTMVFDPDFNSASISPGFTLGLPTLAGPYVNTQLNKNCYQLLLPSGRVIEFRQLSASVFEPGDSSFTRLTLEVSGLMTVRMTDGTQLKYQSPSECIEIKDRNGNLITVTYNGFSQIDTITDTLGRVFRFNYGFYQTLESITLGIGATPRLIAQFSYADNTLETNFYDATLNQWLNHYNTSKGMIYPVLSQVYLPKDNSTYLFEHSAYGQVYETRHVPGGLERSKIRYNLPQTAASLPYPSDCPRFTQRTDTAYEWNTTGVNTAFQFVTQGADVVGQATAPDGTVYKEIAWGTGWQRGLVKETQTLASNTLQKKIETIWEQEALTSYQNNPRVIESKVTDVANGNLTRRTVIGYTLYNLPADVYEYDYNQTTLLRRTHTDYNLDSLYTSRRIIGLPSAQMLYDSSNVLQSKVTYSYDDAGLLQNLSPAPISHDGANYGLGFLAGRANLTKTRRYDVNDASGASYVESQTGYFITGSPALTRDALNHQTNIFYADNFSNSSYNANTYAYPTQIQDPDGYWSYIQYHYHWGEIIRTTDPKGATIRNEYNGDGRLFKTVNEVNNAHTRYEFSPDQYYVESYSTIQEGLGEFYSITVFDGHGRARATVSEHPGSAGQYRGVYRGYDLMGRQNQVSNPTEINTSWVPSGDDVDGWAWSYQTFDWQSRPLVSINQDGTEKYVDYAGCGCAGGQTVTVRDEGDGVWIGGKPRRRQQKMTYDILGRVAETQILNWDGTIYSTTVNSYNVRDQLTKVREFQGARPAPDNGVTCPTGTCQKTEISYDGHGRPQSRKLPIESAPTTYSYFADDTVQTMTDPRGITATYSYNNRKLVTGIDYAEIANLATADVTFGYDERGKRLWMNDGPGRIDYNYDTLSRLNWEDRFIDGVGSYRTDYSYNLAGQLKTITDRYGAVVNYDRDKSGRLTGVTGNGFGGNVTFANQAKYRAWGALKGLVYGNGKTLTLTHNVRLLPTSYNVPGILDKAYQYVPDGKMKFTDDLMDNRYDRSATYDQAGRLSTAFTGTQASGGTQSDGPYRQEYGYDVWGHPLSRTSLHWDQDYSVTASYSNDRRQGQGVVYDAAGHIINEGRAYVYDSAGRLVYVGSQDASYTYDGDGQLLKSYVPNNPPYTTYYLKSSALGNQVISEITPSSTTPNNRRDFIYADGQRLARQTVFRTTNGNDVRDIAVEHQDAMGTSNRTSALVGLGGGPNAELDPLGADVGLNNPYVNQPPYTPPDETDPTYPNFGNPQRFLGQGCSWNGLPVDCPWLMDRIEKTAGGVANYRMDDGWVWDGEISWTSQTSVGADDHYTIRVGSTVTHSLVYWKRGGLSASPVILEQASG